MGNTALDSEINPCAPAPKRRISLSAHYEMIGRALVNWEKSRASHGQSEAVLCETFREEVVFVPVEVLESYLEDLLATEVSESSLYIKRSQLGFGPKKFCSNRLWPKVCAGLGVLVAMTIGLFAASIGASLVYSMAVTLICSLPFVSLWYFAPQATLTRRMTFAQVVSHEIARRRGVDDDRPMRPAFAGEILDLLRSGRAASVGGGYFAVN